MKKRKGRKRKKRGDDSDGEVSTSMKRRRGGQSGVDPKLKRQMRKLMNIVMKYTDR